MLRDISGLIVIDFIDMVENKNKRIVERGFRDFTKKDKAKIQFSNMEELTSHFVPNLFNNCFIILVRWFYNLIYAFITIYSSTY